MAKIKNNVLLRGASGMLGQQIVYREVNGQLIMANRPKKSGVLTAQQIIAKENFLQASLYAKGQVADPLSKAEYETGISDKCNSAYAVALTDYLKAPVIHTVETTGYSGKIGENVAIKATDNFKVTSVYVEIWSAANVMIEQGNATLDATNIVFWNYKTTALNVVLPGSTLVIKAKDKANNITTITVVL
jgi:hypothetical protein